MERFGTKDWKKVSTLVPGRTGPQCRERWESKMTANERLGPWTPEEDAVLIEGVKQFGRGQWTKVCQLLEGRRATSCKVRYRILSKQGKVTMVSKEKFLWVYWEGFWLKGIVPMSSVIQYFGRPKIVRMANLKKYIRGDKP